MPEPSPNGVEIRTVRDVSELQHAFASIAPLFIASVDPEQDFRLDRLLEHFATDRELMLVAVDADGEIRGAALGYRGSSFGAVEVQSHDQATQGRLVYLA